MAPRASRQHCENGVLKMVRDGDPRKCYTWRHDYLLFALPDLIVKFALRTALIIAGRMSLHSMDVATQ